MKKILMFLCAVGLVLAILGSASADLIDFETFTDQQALGSVVTATNTVTFGVGTVSPTGTAYVAAVGSPITAFVPNDTPAGLTAGKFLTDEMGTSLGVRLNYFILFEKPVLNLSLDLYDFRADGGPSAGDTATLIVYSDLFFGSAVGSDIFAIPDSAPVDGNIETLSVSSPSAPILSASLIFSTGDVGTGIDNVAFETAPVPEPATLLLLGSGLVGLAAVGRRKFLKK